MSKPHEELARDLRNWQNAVIDYDMAELIATELYSRGWRKVPPGAGIAPMQLKDDRKHGDYDDRSTVGETRPVVVTDKMWQTAVNEYQRLIEDDPHFVHAGHMKTALQAALAQQQESE